MTGLALISGALTQLGVLAAGETLASDDAAEGLERLNDWIDSLGTERLTIYKLLRTEQVLAQGTASYTLGSGGAINIVRPVWLQDAGLILDNTAAVPEERPIKILTDDEWARLPNKTQTGIVGSVYCNFDWAAGLALVSVYPVPDSATTTLVLYTPVALTEFADLVTDYTFPPGYRRFLRTNLALELAPEYGRPLDPALVQQALESKAQIKRANLRLSELRIDRALVGYGYNGAGYDGESDEYRR